MARVELRGVTKSFPGGVEAVVGLDLSIGEGEFLAILGPSGSGKSTLLRLIAGLESPTEGEIWIEGRRADRLAPRDRGVALVFQNPALYPHLDVFENLAFSLRARRRPGEEVRARVEEAAGWLGLSEVLRRRPATLSGGQRQRVALGRALARRPGIILLDEPLSDLDAPLRAALRADLAELHRRTGSTVVLVTHDQAEALALGNRVAVLDRGRLAQVGPPLEVYDRPACRFVARFVGNPPMNLLPCEIEADSESGAESIRVRLAGTDLEARLSPTAIVPARLGPGLVELGLRSEQIQPLTGPVAGAVLSAEARIERLEPLGHETLATLAIGPNLVRARLARDRRDQPGDRLPVLLDLARATWFDPKTGLRLD